ncbi:MAG: insulinase family protein [Balneolaceae bacterium]|nr:MAG: insulinase family protein [Balneolaceae bacterium]
MMTRHILAIAAILLFCTLTPQQAASQHLRIDVKKHVLDNGLTVLVWERPSAGRIGTRSFYKVDIAAERPGTVGLTHMLEHFLFKGSDIAGTADWEAERAVAEHVERLERMITDEENRNRGCFLQRDVFAEVEADCRTPLIDSLRTALVEATAFQNSLAHTTWYDWAVQSAGGTNSTASTGRDWMKFDIDLPANKLELFMWTERSRVEHPVLRHFEPEKEVVVDQIRRYDNRPDGKFSRVMRSLTYDAHPYGWAHWFSDLTRATREDHWEIFHKYFIPQNTVLVVVGEVDADEVFEMAEAYWGSWQKGRPSPRLRTVEPEPVGQKRLTVDAAAGPAVTMHVPMPAVAHPDAHVFDVLAELIGGSRGLLAAELIDRQGIATGTGASSWTSKYPSHFEIQADGRSNSDLDAIETGINSVLEAVASGSVTPAEIEAAAGRLVLNLARSLDEIGRSAVTIGSMESIYGWEHLNDLPGLWSGTTPADLARVAQRYFGEKMQTVGHLRRIPTGGSMASATEYRGDGYSGHLSDRQAGHLVGRHDSEIPTGSDGLNSKALNSMALSSIALNLVRPGTYPFGGPVGAHFLQPEEKLPGSAFSGPDETGDAGKYPVTQSTSALKTITVDPREPLAISEQPWYTPPWMVDRRPSGFSAPAPTPDYRDLTYDPVGFAPPDPDNYRITLDNGLTTFVVPDNLLPMVQVSVLIDAPAMRDPRGKEGLAALTADLLRTGTSTRSSADIEHILNSMGATLSISSNRNRTRLHALAPSTADISALVGLLGEMVAQPDFDNAFDTERERHALRAGRAADNAAAQSQALFEKTLYGDSHPFGRRPSPASVRSITPGDVKTWHQTRFTANRITFAVSGAVSAEEAGRALRQSRPLNALPPGGSIPHDNLPGPFKPDGISLVTRDIDIRQGLIIMGHKGIEGLPDDHAALEVMHHILAGGGFISRMMELLRTQTGITSALFGEVEPGRGTPNPYLWRFGGNPDTIAEGIRLALEEIRKMYEDGVTEYEFESARTSYMDGLVPASYDTPHKTAERLAQKHLFGLYDYQSPQYLNYYAGDAAQLDALSRLTLEDVNRAARTYLDPENMVITIVGPIETIKNNASSETRQLLGW